MAAGDKLIEPFPLLWPIAQRRTQSARRVGAQQYKLTLTRYRDDLLDEIKKMDGRNIVLTSNVPVRRDGLPYADAREPIDPGVAVYFDRDSQDYCLAIDRYSGVKWNMAALAKTVEALRAIERHGSPSLLAHALGGFRQLPAHEANESWWVVLEVPSDTTSADLVAAARERLALRHHPDKGGSHDAMARINAAYERAVRDLRGAA